MMNVFFRTCRFLAFCLACAALISARAADFKPAQPFLDSAKNVINAHGGNVIFHEGIYYLYGEEKEKGLSEKTHADAGIRCYASKDLVVWYDFGPMLSLTKTDPLSDLAFDCNQDRPKVVYNEKTKTFVMFFKLYLRGMGTNVGFVGVATSPSPAGPFKYSHKFVAGNSPNGTGDFCIFKDTDGTLYHMTVRKPDKAFVAAKMRPDYLLPEGEYKVCKGITFKTEAPCVFKKDGKYYMLASGSTGWAPNAARSFVSDNIFGEWKSLGNPCEGVNPLNGLGPEKTFGGQSSSIIKVEGKDNAYIAAFDINRPEHPYDSGYIWLPIEFKDDGSFKVLWRDEWDMSVFDKK